MTMYFANSSPFSYRCAPLVCNCRLWLGGQRHDRMQGLAITSSLEIKLDHLVSRFMPYPLSHMLLFILFIRTEKVCGRGNVNIIIAVLYVNSIQAISIISLYSTSWPNNVIYVCFMNVNNKRKDLDIDLNDTESWVRGWTEGRQRLT